MVSFKKIDGFSSRLSLRLSYVIYWSSLCITPAWNWKVVDNLFKTYFPAENTIENVMDLMVIMGIVWKMEWF